uniref:Class II aldolase/adducin N-terminal domain-containing protein n=1 Tax=Amphimedon queenslandica TaxID=400682 RepID=A0A1X7TLT6_AMPQE
MRCGLMQLSQESMKVGRVSYHKYTNNIMNDMNKRQLLTDLGPVNKVLFLHNQGLLAMGRTVEEAFSICYNVMRACEIQVQTLSAGRDFALVIRDDSVREFAIRNKEINAENYELEFEAMMRLLDYLGYDTGYPYKRQKISKGERDDFPKSRTKDEELKILSNNIRKEINRIREERKQELQAYYERNSQFQAVPGMYVTGHSSTSMHQSMPVMSPTGIGNMPQDQGLHSEPTASNEWSFLDNRIADSSPIGFRKSTKNRQHVPAQLSTSQPQPILPSTTQPLFQLTSQPVIASIAERAPLVYSPQLTASPSFSSGPALPLHYPVSTLTAPLHAPVTNSLTSEASLPFTSGQTTSFSHPQPFPPLHPPASLLTASSSSYFPQSFSATQSPASLTQSSSMTHSFPASSVAMLHIPSSSTKVFSHPAISLVSHSVVPSSDPGSKVKKQPHFMERVQFNPHVSYVSPDDDSSPPEGQISSSADNEPAATSWSRRLRPSSSSSSTSTGSPPASPSWQPRDINGRLDKVKVKAQVVARSTGQSAERLASHMKKKQQQQGAHSSSSSSMASLSSNGSIKDKSTLTSGDIDVNDDDEITKKLKGLDKVIHTAEQVAQSTGESVEKLSKNLVQSPKLLKNII